MAPLLFIRLFLVILVAMPMLKATQDSYLLHKHLLKDHENSSNLPQPTSQTPHNELALHLEIPIPNRTKAVLIVQHYYKQHTHRYIPNDLIGLTVQYFYIPPEPINLVQSNLCTRYCTSTCACKLSCCCVFLVFSTVVTVGALYVPSIFNQPTAPTIGY